MLSKLNTSRRGQAMLPEVIQDFCEAMYERTGCSFTVLTAMPDPTRNTAIKTFSICTGENPYNQDFATAYAKFKTKILTPFAAFAETVYSKFLSITT